ncbi:MAG: ATP-binding protein, partial [Candidatus Omnitrophota bacterium]
YVGGNWKSYRLKDTYQAFAQALKTIDPTRAKVGIAPSLAEIGKLSEAEKVGSSSLAVPDRYRKMKHREYKAKSLAAAARLEKHFRQHGQAKDICCRNGYIYFGKQKFKRHIYKGMELQPDNYLDRLIEFVEELTGEKAERHAGAGVMSAYLTGDYAIKKGKMDETDEQWQRQHTGIPYPLAILSTKDRNIRIEERGRSINDVLRDTVARGNNQELRNFARHIAATIRFLVEKGYYRSPSESYNTLDVDLDANIVVRKSRQRYNPSLSFQDLLRMRDQKKLVALDPGFWIADHRLKWWQKDYKLSQARIEEAVKVFRQGFEEGLQNHFTDEQPRRMQAMEATKASSSNVLREEVLSNRQGLKGSYLYRGWWGSLLAAKSYLSFRAKRPRSVASEFGIPNSPRAQARGLTTQNGASSETEQLTVISDFSDTVAQPAAGGEVPAFEKTLRVLVAQDIPDQKQRVNFEREAEFAYAIAKNVKWDGTKESFTRRAQVWLEPFIGRLNKKHIEKVVEGLSLNKNLPKAVALIRGAQGLKPGANITINFVSGTLKEIIDLFMVKNMWGLFSGRSLEEELSWNFYAIPALNWDDKDYYRGGFKEQAHPYAYQGAKAYPENSIVLGDNRMENPAFGFGDKLFNIQKTIDEPEFKQRLAKLFTPSSSFRDQGSRVVASQQHNGTPSETLKKDFTVSLSQMQDIVSAFRDEMAKGLAGKESSLAMLPSFVDIPTGKEIGRFLALDLGGTNFRVLMVELKGEGFEPRVVSEQFKLKKEHITTTQEVLFDAIAQFVKQFLNKHNFTDTYNLGFTFSFEVNQEDINKGITVRMSKGFVAKGIVGKDVVELLRQAFQRNGINNVKVVSLDNDTVGTQVARAYGDTNASLGVILGTGTNISIRLPMERIKKDFSNKDKYQAPQMIVNMEAGSFNKNLPRIAYDKLLDVQSTNPQQAWEEKMVSGMYLGELMRLVLVDLIEKGILLKGKIPQGLRVKGGFGTELMSKIEALNLGTIRGRWKARRYLNKLLVSKKDLKTIQEIASLISTRSARIAAAVIAGAILAIDPNLERPHTAAIDGSLFEKYYRYQEHMDEAFRELLGDKASRITTTLTHDGSGLGAAIIAAVASQQPAESVASSGVKRRAAKGRISEFCREMIAEPRGLYHDFCRQLNYLMNIPVLFSRDVQISQEVVKSIRESVKDFDSKLDNFRNQKTAEKNLLEEELELAAEETLRVLSSDGVKIIVKAARTSRSNKMLTRAFIAAARTVLIILTNTRAKSKVENLLEYALTAEACFSRAEINPEYRAEEDLVINRYYQNSPETPLVSIPRGDLLRIFMNILRNAKFHLGESEIAKKEINITTRVKSGHVEVVINDTGLGMTKEQVRAMRKDDVGGAKSTRGGGGNGTRSIKRLVRKNKGSIELKIDSRNNSQKLAKQGIGTQYTITIPAASSGVSSSKIYTLSLKDNDQYVSAIVDYIERYIAIQKGHQEKGTPEDHYLDFTGKQEVGILLPEEEADNNVYLSVAGKEPRLIFSKDIKGFQAYESEVPIFFKLNERNQILAVYIAVNGKKDFLEIKITQGKAEGAPSVDPRRLILDASGKLPYRLNELYVWASLVSASKLSPGMATSSPLSLSVSSGMISWHHRLAGRVDSFSFGLLLHMLSWLRIYDLGDVVKAMSYQQRQIGFINQEMLKAIEIKTLDRYRVAYLSHRDPDFYQKGVNLSVEPKNIFDMIRHFPALAKKYRLDIFPLLVKRAHLDLTAKNSQKCLLCSQYLPLAQKGFSWDKYRLLIHPFAWSKEHCFVLASRSHDGKATEMIDSRSAVAKALKFVKRAKGVT